MSHWPLEARGRAAHLHGVAGALSAIGAFKEVEEMACEASSVFVWCHRWRACARWRAV